MNFKKKFVSFLILIGAIFALTSGFAYGSTLGMVNGYEVNVRDRANKNSSVITRYSAGEALEILGSENGFYRIEVDGAELYISSDYVDILKTEAVVNSENVNIRDKASMESRIITKLNIGEKVTVIGIEESQWLKIEYNGDTAYIKKNFLKGDFVKNITENSNTDTTNSGSSSNSDASEIFVQASTAPKAMAQDSLYAVVASTTGLRLRSEPSTDSQILSLVPSGEAVDVLSQQPGWVKISFAGREGYVSEEFVEFEYGTRPAKSGSLSEQVIDYGKKFLGTPYLWAGNDLTKGVDCSGFVYNVYLKFGVKLNRSSASMVNNGKHVEKSDLQTGDLIFFSNTGSSSGGISHVGIYMGDGRFIHSSSSKKSWGVTISNLGDAYYVKNYITARRVI